MQPPTPPPGHAPTAAAVADASGWSRLILLLNQVRDDTNRLSAAHAETVATASTPVPVVGLVWEGWTVHGHHNWLLAKDLTPGVSVLLSHPDGYWLVTTVPTATDEGTDADGRKVRSRWQDWSVEDRWNTVFASAIHDTEHAETCDPGLEALLRHLLAEEAALRSTPADWLTETQRLRESRLRAAVRLVLTADRDIHPEIAAVHTLAALDGYGNLPKPVFGSQSAPL